MMGLDWEEKYDDYPDKAENPPPAKLYTDADSLLLNSAKLYFF